MNASQALTALHETYCRQTGMRLVLTMERLLAWEHWLAHFERVLAGRGSAATPEQALRAIIAHRRRQYADKPQVLNSLLAFKHLVLRPELAEEDFAAWQQARRLKAGQGDPARNATLRATARPDDSTRIRATRPAQTADQVLSQGKIAELLRGLRAAVDDPPSAPPSSVLRPPSSP
jgi:hypothetical protein